MKKNIFIFLTMLLFSLALTGCEASKPLTPQPANQAVEKVGDTILTGTVFVQSNRIYLKNVIEKPQETVEIDSYSLDLQEFSDKRVQVRGQYSGDTLFISEISVKDGN